MKNGDTKSGGGSAVDEAGTVAPTADIILALTASERTAAREPGIEDEWLLTSCAKEKFVPD